MILLLELIALMGTVLGVAAWLAVSAGARWWPGRDGSPAHRERTARTWLYAPLWLPLVVLAAAGVARAVAFGADHCLSHTAHHHHLCFLHRPVGHGHAVAWSIAIAAFAPSVLVLASWLRGAANELRAVRSLVRSSRGSGLGDDVRVLDRPEPIALTVGWFAPTILVSRGLLDAASPSTMDAVIAHERAHVRRRHTMHAFADRWVASLLPRRVGQHLVDVLTLAREQRCDADAAQAVGSRVAVARALTEVARLNRDAPRVGASIDGGDLAARVRALLAPEPRDTPTTVLPTLAVAAAAFAGCGPAFVWFEHVVTRILH